MIDSIALLATPTELASAPDPIEPVNSEEDEAAYWVRIESLADQVDADSELSWRLAMLAGGEHTSTGWAPDEGRGGPFGDADQDAFGSLDALGLIAGPSIDLTADGDAVADVLAERARR